VKAAILVESFEPNRGYIEYYLARELTKLGSEVKIFTFQNKKEITESEIEGFSVVSIPSLLSIHRYSFFSVRNAYDIIKIIKKDSPDIIHSQPLFSPLSLFFMNFDRVFDYKIVGSLLTGELFIDKLSSRLQFDFIRFLVTKYADRKAEVIFALSQDIKRILLRFFPTTAEKIHVIPLGADHKLFRFSKEARHHIRESLGLSQDDLVITSIGKMIPEKRLDLIIEALATFKSLEPLKLLLVGAGSFAYVESLKKLAKSLNIENRVLFHPTVHRTKVPEYYSASDIGVFPASSISIIEAMSTGLPVIVGKSFVSRCELEYDNGFSFDVRRPGGDFGTLIANLKKLISNPELRTKMGRRSRALVEDKLNWEKISKTYLDLYKIVLEK
jgi:glycosyltransferase involved in cell wall biosynthesis